MAENLTTIMLQLFASPQASNAICSEQSLAKFASIDKVYIALQTKTNTVKRVLN